MQIDDDIRAWLILLRAPGIGPATLRELIERAGSAGSAIAQSRRLRGELALSRDAIVGIESPDMARIEA
ncbi:MAG: DNA-processing protein DprA, partial [Rhodanobacteraceae bacterium]